MLSQSCRASGSGLCGAALMILIGAGTLTGCGPRRPEVSAPAHPPAPTVPPGPLSLPPGARQYAIDAKRSVVTLRVYRAGPLARLGHNHVITSAAESGHVWTAAALEASGFEVRVPVATLEVDDPAARSAAGPDFPGVVPEDAREGTRRNMLRPEVLDADRYPEVIVRARSLAGSWKSPVAHAEVTLRDRVRRIDVPLTVTLSPGAVTARGTFRILQSDFGITPFSVGGGAIQVADAVAVEFEFSAVAP